jgi:glycerol kinase
VIQQALQAAGVGAADLAAVGITNQRETTIVWDRRTGLPYHNAVVWQDTRTAALVAELERAGQGEVIRERAGIPPAPYFAGGKLAWLLAHVDGLRAAAEAGDALFGTIDTWLLWHLTGVVDGGRHLTDVTNASRTMLMNLAELAWDPVLLELFDIPEQMLPRIVPSSHHEAFGTARTAFGGEVVIGGVLGDQHAAMVGQVCLDVGEAKNTYGTGNFLLLNTGTEIVRSAHGLLSTVCYQFGDEPARYALEGSIAVTGSAIQWLRDQLGIVTSAEEADQLAASVPGTDGLCFVPAFSGLFAPYWRPDARGAIVGLTRFHTAAHLARATLESICYSSYDLVKAMEADAGVTMTSLKVDGGVTASSLTMQLQADVLGIDVIRPVVRETTALGAGYAAGLAVGVWDKPEDFRENWQEDRRWVSSSTAAQREAGAATWHKAVQRTLDWVEH